MNNRDAALSILFGAAIGAAAGILLAPASGQETRRRIRHRGEEALDRGREVLEEKQDSLRLKADAVRDRVSNVTDRVADRVAHVADRVSNVTDGVHQRIDAARNAVGEGKATYRRELDKPSTPTA